MNAVVGLLVFTQFWYWFPLAHFISLAFQPTALITLNQDLKMPKLEFLSNAAPSVFGYPPPMEEKKGDKKEKVEKAVLSITDKKKKRDAEKKSEKEEKMDVDEKPAAVEAKDKDSTSGTAATVTDADKEKEKKEKEPDFEILQNPSRVMKPQVNEKNSKLKFFMIFKLFVL